MIYIVGLGPGDAGSVTPHALEAMRNCGRVLLRTEALDAGGYLGAAGIKYEALDGLYESAGDFDSLCAAIAGRVMDSAAECDTAYAVADLAEASVGGSHSCGRRIMFANCSMDVPNPTDSRLEMPLSL